MSNGAPDNKKPLRLALYTGGAFIMCTGLGFLLKFEPLMALIPFDDTTRTILGSALTFMGVVEISIARFVFSKTERK